MTNYIDENELKEQKTLVNLECAVLDMIKKYLEDNTDMDEDTIEEYLEEIEIDDYDKAIEDSKWDFRLLNGDVLVLKYEVADIPFEAETTEKMLLEAKYKGFSINN